MVTKTLNLTYDEADFEKMKAYKDQRGFSWEDLVFFAVMNFSEESNLKSGKGGGK